MNRSRETISAKDILAGWDCELGDLDLLTVEHLVVAWIADQILGISRPVYVGDKTTVSL